MIIQVTVKPGAKIEKIVSGSGASDSGADLTVYLHARAHDGEANEALVKVLAKHYGVSKSCVTILKGTKNHHKVVEIL